MTENNYSKWNFHFNLKKREQMKTYKVMNIFNIYISLIHIIYLYYRYKITIIHEHIYLVDIFREIFLINSYEIKNQFQCVS